MKQKLHKLHKLLIILSFTAISAGVAAVAQGNTATGVISKKTTITVTVNPLPFPPVTHQVNMVKSSLLNPESILSGAEALPGHTLHWYTTQKKPDGTGSLTAPMQDKSEEKTVYYWVTQTSPEGCESDTSRVTVSINAIKLTISGPTLTTSKIYDGSTTAAVTAGTLLEIVDGDDVSVSATATYDNANVGTGKTITVTYTLSGADAGKYIQPADYVVTTGEITALPITITAEDETIDYGHTPQLLYNITSGNLLAVDTKIANALPGNFHHCNFLKDLYEKDSLLLLNTGISPFAFRDTSVYEPHVVDLKELVLASGDTTGITLKYYINNVELSNTVISATGKYLCNIVGTAAGGCLYSTKVNITITPVPTISGSSSICCDTEATYTTESGMSNYNWIVEGGEIIAGSGPDDHYVTIRWNTPSNGSVSVQYTKADIETIP